MIDIDAILQKIRRYFPMQGPIKDFLHFNALSGFQNIPFEKAVLMVGELYAAHAYMPLSYYRSAHQRGQINEGVFSRIIDGFAHENELSNNLAHKVLFEYVDIHDTNVYFELVERAGISRARALRVLQSVEAREIKRGAHFLRIREGCKEQAGMEMDFALNATLFRIVSGFLDQGITLWKFPTTDVPFFQAVRSLVSDSYVSIAPYVRRSAMLAALQFSPDEIIDTLLQKIVGDERLAEAYVKDTLMVHPGWSGMVNYLESKPSFLLHRREITLKDFLAFKLILEWEFISSNCRDFVPLASWTIETENQHELIAHERRALSYAWLKLSQPELSNEIIFDALDLRKVWHEALEQSAYGEILSAVKKHEGYRRNKNRPLPSVQALFCLDDRETSIRRYLEELDPSIETYGCPGFFGVDFLFQSLNDAQPIQLCPPVLSPKHVVREIVADDQQTEFFRQKQRTHKMALALERWREASSSLFMGFVAAVTIGHLSVFHMLKSIFKPKELAKTLKSRRIDVRTRLTIHREDGHLYGFTHTEMASRVESVLTAVGLTKNCAPIVVVMAHGASSVNNPHFAAYDCAACSGKSGAPNARAFAHMGNIPKVRDLLRKKGIDIPDDTFFVGGYHDTTTDFVEYFDLENYSQAQRAQFEKFSQTVEIARGRNAQERCRRFSSAPLDISEEEALHEVSKRALAFFEPRAELGHATCYSCVVGRRDLTRGLFLDRRAFLNSYDPTTDADGQILAQILSAAIPVCGTVNLDYYFSRIDSGKYGCGTKLSHNIVGMLGVCNGVDDDLRTGLPIQMTELHDPIRLLMVIEQEPEIIIKVLRENPSLLEWVENAWVRVASVSPSTGAVKMAGPDLFFHDFDLVNEKIMTYESSRACYAGQRENLPMASIS